MKKIGGGQHGRLSIDILPDEHKQIKIYATLHGQSIREFVLESIRKRLRREAEDKHLKESIFSPGGRETEKTK